MATQEHYNHDVRIVDTNQGRKYYLYDLLAGKDIPKVFNTENEAIKFSNKVKDSFWSK